VRTRNNPMRQTLDSAAGGAAADDDLIAKLITWSPAATGFGGLRLGELLGLRQRHIQLDAATVNVDEQIVSLEGGRRADYRSQK
jgi:hypothetical protein